MGLLDFFRRKPAADLVIGDPPRLRDALLGSTEGDRRRDRLRQAVELKGNIMAAAMAAFAMSAAKA